MSALSIELSAFRSRYEGFKQSFNEAEKAYRSGKNPGLIKACLTCSRTEYRYFKWLGTTLLTTPDLNLSSKQKRIVEKILCNMKEVRHMQKNEMLAYPLPKAPLPPFMLPSLKPDTVFTFPKSCRRMGRGSQSIAERCKNIKAVFEPAAKKISEQLEQLVLRRTQELHNKRIKIYDALALAERHLTKTGSAKAEEIRLALEQHNQSVVDFLAKIDKIDKRVAQHKPDQLSAYSIALEPKSALDRKAFNRQWEPMIVELEKRIQRTHAKIEQFMSLQMQRSNADIEKWSRLLESTRI